MRLLSYFFRCSPNLSEIFSLLNQRLDHMTKQIDDLVASEEAQDTAMAAQAAATNTLIATVSQVADQVQTLLTNHKKTYDALVAALQAGQNGIVLSSTDTANLAQVVSQNQADAAAAQDLLAKVQQASSALSTLVQPLSDANTLETVDNAG